MLVYYNLIKLSQNTRQNKSVLEQHIPDTAKRTRRALLFLRQFGQFSFKTDCTVTAAGAGHLAQQGFSPVDGQPVGRKKIQLSADSIAEKYVQ